MKKLNFLFMVMLALTIGTFTSCSDDEEDNPPTVNMTEIGEPTYTPGSSVSYEVTMSGNQELVEAWITESTMSDPSFEIADVSPADAFDDEGLLEFKNNLNSVTFTYTYHIPASTPGETVVTLTWEVDDKDELTGEASETFTVVAAAGEIEKFTAILMGGQSNTTVGSYLNAHTGDVHLQDAADNAQGDIDLVYYFGSDNKATLCAPVDATVNGGTGNLSLCEAWTIKNPTKLGASTITAAQFDAIADDADIADISALAETKMTQLAVDNVFAFTTVDDKNGLVKVVALEDGADKTIEIEVIIQK